MSLKIEIKNNEKKLRFTNFEANILTELDDISDKLYTLNSELSSYFSEIDSDMPSDIQKKIESLIDKVDNVYIDNTVKPICKRAIVDGLTVEEFQEKFDEFCSDCGIVNSQTLIDIALDIFEFESSIFKKL